jgi:hypothetical protein
VRLSRSTRNGIEPMDGVIMFKNIFAVRIIFSLVALTCILIIPRAHSAALFNPVTGELALPAVQVSGTTYVDVRFTLIDPARYVFRLVNATVRSPSIPTDISFDPAVGSLSIPFVSVGSVAYSVKMQLIDPATYTFALSSAQLVHSGTKLYIGYYVEDVASNPEDPTVGTLLVSFPQADGDFYGLMPFSYAGCGGEDIVTGAVTGSRSGASVGGVWTGTIDQLSVGGSFAGTYDVPSDSYSGSYANNGGKVRTSCFYVAPTGTWKVFGETASQPTNFVLSSSSGIFPRFSWRSLGTGYYIVRVFDESCLKEDTKNKICFKGEAFTTGLSVTYPTDFIGSSALIAGKKYIATISAQSTSDLSFLGFSSVRFAP